MSILSSIQYHWTYWKKLNGIGVKAVDQEQKIFCISHQKSGTTSVGDFFEHFDYRVVRSYEAKRRDWITYWMNRNFEAIFEDPMFKQNQVFEDAPWWFPEFYKVLFHRFPNAVFILMDRDPEEWYQSLLRFGNGENLGDTYIHSRLYGLEYSFHKKNQFAEDISVDWKFDVSKYTEHYKQKYFLKNYNVKRFFKKKGPERLFYTPLKDPDKWQKLGEFMNIAVPKDFTMHSNKSRTKQ